MTKQWILYSLAAVGMTVLALHIWRKMNPAKVESAPVNQQYTTETDKSIVTVGPAVIRTLSEKKEWDDSVKFADDYIPRGG